MIKMDRLDLEESLRAIESTKATERKIGVASLQRLLQLDTVIKRLDHDSQYRTNIGWTVVFKFVRNYVTTEMTAIQAAKESQSSTTLNNRQKKKHEVMILFKLVVKSATIRTPYLKLNHLLDSIITGLTNPFLLENFGQDFSDLLHKYVLKVRKYWLGITPEQWRELLQLHCRLFLEKAFDSSLLAAVIQELIEGCVKQGKPDTNEMLIFFKKALNIISETQPSSQAESLVTALNMFVYSVAGSARHCLCEFAQDCMVHLLNIWDKMGTEKIKLKEELIKLLHFQVILHHPKGLGATLDGSLAHDWDAWKVHLERLHDSLVSHIDHLSTKQKFLPGHRSKPAVLKDNFVSLVTDVFKQLPCLVPTTFCEDEVDNSDDDGGGGLSAKRPRLSPSRKTLLDLIKEHSNSPQAVPWLQVMTSLLLNYPVIFDHASLCQILKVMASMLTDCTRGQLFRHVFDTLAALMQVFLQHESSLLEKSLKDWQIVWTASLSNINSSHAKIEGCQENGFLLMSAILQSNLLHPGKEIWNVFMPDYCQPSAASASLLVSLLQTQKLPENYFPNIFGLSKDNKPFPLRRLLLRWLLSCLELDNSVISKHGDSFNFSPEQMAVLCLSLLHKDPGAVLEKAGLLYLKQSQSYFNHHEKNDTADLVRKYANDLDEGVILKELQNHCMKRNFVKEETTDVRIRQQIEWKNEMHYANPLVCDMADFLVKSLRCCIECACESDDAQNYPTSVLPSLAWSASFLLSTIQQLGSNVPQTQDLCYFTKKYIGKCIQLFTLESKKLDLCDSKLPVLLQPLVELVNVKEHAGTDAFWIAEFTRSCFSNEFVQLIIDFAHGKAPARVITKGTGLRRNRYGSSFDQRNDSSERDDFEDSLIHHSNGDMMNNINNQDGDSSQLDSHCRVSNFLQPAGLKNIECVRFLCIKLLCQLIQFDKESSSIPIYVEFDLDVDNVRCQLLDMIGPDNFKCNTTLDLLNVLTISQSLLSSHLIAPPSVVKPILVGYRNVAKELNKDWEVCKVLLRHLSVVVTHLKSRDDLLTELPNSLLACRKVFFTFVSDFGIVCNKIEREDVRIEYCSILLELIKHDPYGTWGKLEIELENNDGNDDDEEVAEETATEVFVRYIKDGNVSVGMTVADNLKWYFIKQSTSSHIQAQDRKKQLKTLDNITSHLNNVMAMQLPNTAGRSYHQSFKKDASSNRVDVCLCSAKTILLSSSVCEKECLLWICRAVTDFEMPVKKVVKMLEVVCKQKSYPDVRTYLSSHLPYLLYHWLNRYKASIQEFPHQLLDHQMEEFVKTHQQLVVSSVFIATCQMDILESLLKSVNCDVHAAMVSSLPRILVCLLPCLVDTPDNVSQSRGQGDSCSSSNSGAMPYRKAKKCYDLLKTEFTDSEINDCVSKHLCQITVFVLGCLHVERSTGSIPVRDPNPPYCNQTVVQATLDHLANAFPLTAAVSNEPTFLVAVLARVPSGLHSVLLSIATLMFEQRCPWERLRCIHMYSLFVGMVMEQLPSGLEGGWAAVLRDIIYRLIIFLKSSPSRCKNNDNNNKYASSNNNKGDVEDKDNGLFEDEIILVCLDILKSVCHTSIETCPDEFAKYIHQIVYTVASCASRGDPVMSSCCSVIETIRNMNSKEAEDPWMTVRLLPDLACFRSVNEWLSSLRHLEGKPLILRLQDFLELCTSVDGGDQSLVQELNALTSLLSAHPKDLETLMTSTAGRTTVQKISYLLLQLICSQCPELVNAAARCMGAIGPLDLHALAYPDDTRMASSYYMAMEIYKDTLREKHCWLFHFLDSCLLDENVEVVRMAGDTLKKVMSTETAVRFEADYGGRMKGVSFLFHYLQPFKGKVKGKSMPPPLARLSSLSIDSLRDLNLWSPLDHGKSHEVWIRDITCSLLDTIGAITDEVLSKIRPMCQMKVEMCEEGLPYLIHNMLESDNSGVCREVLSRGFSYFFHEHCTHCLEPVKEPLPVCLRKESIRAMLKVVQYLRKQKRKQQSSKRNAASEMTAWENNFWLKLNYLEVAKAAEYCQAYFSAFLFTEIWWDNSRNSDTSSPGSPGSSPEGSQGESSIHPLSLVTPDEEKSFNVQSLLLTISRGIGDLDLLYGCGAGRRPESNSRVLTYLHEQEQSKALTSLDIEARHNGSSDTPLVLLQAIQGCGADHLLMKCLNGLDMSTDTGVKSSSPELEEFRYQTAWRLGQWDLGLPSSKEISKGLPFHQAVYSALSSLRENHLDVARIAIHSARKTSILSFDSKVECSQSVLPFLSKLQSLNVLEDLVSSMQAGEDQILPLMSSVLEEGNDDSSLLCRLQDFSCQRNLLELLVSSSSVLQVRNPPMARQLGAGALWKLVVCGRQAGQFQDAEKAMHVLKNRVSELEFCQSENNLQFEEAKLYWARSEVNIALNLLKTLSRKLEGPRGSTNDPLLPEVLTTYANWLAHTRSESPSVIVKNYLEKSVSLIDCRTASQSVTPIHQMAMECFVSLARFADAQYQQISDYMASPVYKEKKDLLKRTQMELQEYHEYKRSNKYLVRMERNSVIDKAELESLESDYTQFREQALINYLRCLRDCSMHDVKVFRVVALWFENATSRDVSDLIQVSCKDIATYKFLPLYYQLAARMTTKEEDSSSFQVVLIELMERVARQHPHHTLWVVMALAHAKKDDQVSRKRHRGKLASDKEQTIEGGRVQAAKEMLDRLKQESMSSSSSGGREGLADVVKKMEGLSLAYIQLANKCVSEHKNERKPLPLDNSLDICGMKDLSGILIPSIELKVQMDADYSKVPYPMKFGSSFKLAGGVNLPKIITCIGSDGIQRTQLVKGNDDLRQDAVMQQVFALVNQLLTADPSAKKRELNIRTYKVVPLTQKCGLLEWCEGTQPIGQYLTGDILKPRDGAHAKYRPQDWRAMDCRRCLKDGKADPKARMKAYLEICANFKPVFRHFFMETFKDPTVWFQSRLAYTKSVATNSIVGYILGLGDRHVQNILIDMKTAELIHIDLGIAFEMGHTLPTPETVPFRLTRDLVDGMGITGVEGPFRRCCEKTMQVMRNNGDLLLTIVQVLLHDPLMHWAPTPQLLMAIQKKREQAMLDNDSVMSSVTVPSSGQPNSEAVLEAKPSGEAKDNDSKMAERTLLRLKQKLNGIEDGAQLGLEGQVNCLIQQATDPKNLSRLFEGWQPYL